MVFCGSTKASPEAMPAVATVRGRRVKALIAILVLAVAGCLPARSTPRPIPALSGLLPIAVYRFTDSRGKDAHVIGQDVFGSRGGSASPMRARTPVDLTVTRAFADALKARGFPVVDRTDVAFVPGTAPENVDGLVSGEITDYWWEREVRTGGPYGAMTNFSYRARCTITVRAHARASGEKLWEKTYSRELGASGGIGNPNALTQVLARTVRAAVMDRELVEQLGGARGP